MRHFRFTLVAMLLLAACGQNPKEAPKTEATPIEPLSPAQLRELAFTWDNATVYFMLTDRFANGDPTNDQAYDRKPDGAVLRDYKGGDLRGITQKIKEGYFDRLGINVIWCTPPIENIHGYTDEGTGKTYAFHGYWPRDWTAVDPNLGTMEDLKEMVDEAHKHGIRVLMDIIINHTGPVTDVDSKWPDEWVRTGPVCQFEDYETTVRCDLVKNLPDVRTESVEEVQLPPFLVAKWESEGRYEQEVKELDAFFERTGYPRAPRYYIIKWLTDYVRELGFDGFRVDTAKHVEMAAWSDLLKQAQIALDDWRVAHPAEQLDDKPFFMMAETYGYGIWSGLGFDMGDTIQDFYSAGFNSMINFSFKGDAKKPTRQFFAEYDSLLHRTDLAAYTTLNYISSHDDGEPMDPMRDFPIQAGTKLLLSPGGAQVYYGDETSRVLRFEGADGDAHLRTFMNWEDLAVDSSKAAKTLAHYQKLGQFRREHPAVGAGRHIELGEAPFTFARVLAEEDMQDQVVVVIEPDGNPVSTSSYFEDGETVIDYYSGQSAKVENKQVHFPDAKGLLLIGKRPL